MVIIRTFMRMMSHLGLVTDAQHEQAMIDNEVSGIGERLKNCRKNSGLSQAQFAEALGVSSRSYQHYENATREAPVSVLTTAARVSGRDFHWLITGKLEGQVDLYEQAVLSAFDCLEREGLPQQPKTILAIARRALELALEKNTKPADEVPKLVQDSRYLLAS